MTSRGKAATPVGVSLRTVFRHFDDLDALMESAVRRQLDRVGPMFEQEAVGAGASLAERADALARHRERLYEEVAPVRRAAVRLASFSSAVGDALAASRRTLRRNLERQFESELSNMPATVRRTTLDAADAAAGAVEMQPGRTRRNRGADHWVEPELVDSITDGSASLSALRMR